MEDELRRKQSSLQQYGAELEKRESALEHLRIEMTETKREILEMRLATEQVWSQLSETISPAVLTQSIAQTRAKLADHYSLAKADLCERKEELQQVARQVVEQHEKLQTQKDDLNGWVTRRQEEIELQAVRVVAREHELDRQKAHCDEIKLRFHEERLAYEHEIRELMATLHHADATVEPVSSLAEDRLRLMGAASTTQNSLSLE